MARGDIFPLNAAREPFFVKMWPAYETEFETPALMSRPVLINLVSFLSPFHNQLFQLNCDIPAVNFINVKRARFSYKRLFSSYVLALNKLSYKKFAVNFINVLRTAFTLVGPKSVKRY